MGIGMNFNPKKFKLYRILLGTKRLRRCSYYASVLRDFLCDNDDFYYNFDDDKHEFFAYKSLRRCARYGCIYEKLHIYYRNPSNFTLSKHVIDRKFKNKYRLCYYNYNRK